MNKLTDSPYVDKTDPASSHVILSNWVRSLPAGSKILDLGTATGTLGRMCQDLDLIINGVEPEEKWVKVAQPYYNQIQIGLIDDVPDEFLQGYSAIICADILEHTPSPGNILLRLIKLQNTRALFLISVPNVANIYIRLKLLFGQFDYADRGILDRTHLSFFTRKSFLALLKSVDLEILEVRVTPIPFDLVNPFFKRSLPGKALFGLLKFVTPLFPTLMGYQFVIKAIIK